jgi:ferredoxin
MALAIDMEQCTSCGACEPICPTKAISHDDKTFSIDVKMCEECDGFYEEAQCVLICPEDCIHIAKVTPPIPTVKRAKLYQQVVKLLDKPDGKIY